MSERALRPYQELMIDHMIAHPKCAIWAFMGAGKSVSTLTAIDRMLLAGLIDKPVLIVAPLRVARDVWPTEAREWAHLSHLRVVPIVGTETERRNALREPADVYSVNFENLVWLIQVWGNHWPYGMLVIDESTKLKSLRANIRSNANGTSWVQGQGGVRPKALLEAMFRHKFERFVELTGTPAPNGLIDLWGQMFFLDFGKRLGRVFDAFKNRWFKSSFDGYGSEPIPTAQAEIHEAVKDLCLALKSEDWFDLKAPIIRPIYIDLPPSARAQYREMEKQMYTEIQSVPIEAFNAGAKTQKLLQFASGAAYLGKPDDPGPRKWADVHEEKLNALEEIVEESAGAPLLVGYNFKSDLARILKRFPKAVHFDQTPGILERWNKGQIPMLAAHPGSVGHGLSLQHGGSTLVRYSSDWNSEQFDQMLERIGPVRQAQSGYTRNVFEYRIIARGTIDEDVYEKHASTRSVQDCLIDGMRRRLTK
jgi:SNF2 family DNA or RNA helicase